MILKEDKDLPAKIQSFVAQITSDYCTSARFSLPDDALLDTNRTKWYINRQTYTLILPNFIKRILHPISSTNITSNTKEKANKGVVTEKLTALTFNEHKVKELKKGDPKFFREVVQKRGLFLQEVQNPRDDNKEECGKYLFNGKCNSKCARRASHTLPSGKQKLDALGFRSDCLGIYNKAKSASDQDFQ